MLPEVAQLAGVPQPKAFHPEGDVWTHTQLMLEQMVHPSAELAWAVLLHDVGKPPTFERAPDGVERFPCHAQAGSDLARKMFKRLHCASQFSDRVSTAIRFHMGFADVRKMKQSTLRRLLARETLGIELERHRLDCLSSHRRLENYVFVLDKLAELKDEPAVPPPLVNGRDALAAQLQSLSAHWRGDVCAFVSMRSGDAFAGHNVLQRVLSFCRERGLGVAFADLGDFPAIPGWFRKAFRDK